MRDDDTYNLIEAAEAGDVALVQRYIPNANVGIQGNRALRCAVKKGHNDCIALLLPASNLHDDVAYEDLIIDSIENGYIDCMKTLLLYPNLKFDPYLSVMYYVMCAVQNEHVDIVRFLMPLAQHKISKDERYSYKLLQHSIIYPHEEMFNELLKISNPQLAWDNLQKQGYTQKQCFLVVDHLQRLELHKNISDAVENNDAHSPSRKL